MRRLFFFILGIFCYSASLAQLDSIPEKAPLHESLEHKSLDLDQGGKKTFVIPDNFPTPKINIQQFVSKHVKYPPLALEQGVQGKVYIKALVTEEGNLDSIQIGKGLKNGGAGINQEAIRVISMIPDGSFMPALIKGEPIAYWISIPLAFTVEGSNSKKKKKQKFKKGRT